MSADEQEIAAAAKEVAATMPPLSNEQVAQIAALLAAVEPEAGGVE